MGRGWVDDLLEKNTEAVYIAKDGDDFANHIIEKIPSLNNFKDINTIKMAFEAGMCSGIQQVRQILSATMVEELGAQN